MDVLINLILIIVPLSLCILHHHNEHFAYKNFVSCTSIKLKTKTNLIIPQTFASQLRCQHSQPTPTQGPVPAKWAFQETYLVGQKLIQILEIFSSAGAQGGPPEDISLRRIDYFELTLLKKQPNQEGHSDLSVSLKAKNKSSSIWRWKSSLITRDREFELRCLYKQALVCL